MSGGVEVAYLVPKCTKFTYRSLDPCTLESESDKKMRPDTSLELQTVELQKHRREVEISVPYQICALMMLPLPIIDSRPSISPSGPMTYFSSLIRGGVFISRSLEASIQIYSMSALFGCLDLSCTPSTHQ